MNGARKTLSTSPLLRTNKHPREEQAHRSHQQQPTVSQQVDDPCRNAWFVVLIITTTEIARCSSRWIFNSDASCCCASESVSTARCTSLTLRISALERATPAKASVMPASSAPKPSVSTRSRPFRKLASKWIQVWAHHLPLTLRFRKTNTLAITISTSSTFISTRMTCQHKPRCLCKTSS